MSREAKKKQREEEERKEEQAALDSSDEDWVVPDVQKPKKYSAAYLRRSPTNLESGSMKWIFKENASKRLGRRLHWRAPPVGNEWKLTGT